MDWRRGAHRSGLPHNFHLGDLDGLGCQWNGTDEDFGDRRRRLPHPRQRLLLLLRTAPTRSNVTVTATVTVQGLFFVDCKTLFCCPAVLTG